MVRFGANLFATTATVHVVRGRRIIGGGGEKRQPGWGLLPAATTEKMRARNGTFGKQGSECQRGHASE